MKQTKYEWVYLYAAVAARDRRVGRAAGAQRVDAVFPRMLSRDLKPREHALLVLDGAGWHKSKSLVMPDNVTCLLLPPY